MAAYKTNKNGIVELLRFVCSVWVAYLHGFFPILSDKFNGVILPVDFFFLVTGFYFLKSIEKFRVGPFWHGIRFVFWDRTKRFIVPLIIAASSVLFCNIFAELDLGFNWPLSFLWFFAAQFTFLSFYYVLRRIIKKTLVFNLVCGIMICISLSLFKFEIKAFDICFRVPAMIAIGMLLSQIPKINIKLKNEIRAKRLNIAINAVGFAFSAATAFYLIYRPEYAVWKIHLICCLLFPAILYFATSLPVRSRFLNLLGEISLFVYLAQCPILIHHYFVIEDTKKQFPWLVICALFLFLLNRIINRISATKKLKRAA